MHSQANDATFTQDEEDYIERNAPYDAAYERYLAEQERHDQRQLRAERAPRRMRSYY